MTQDALAAAAAPDSYRVRETELEGAIVQLEYFDVNGQTYFVSPGFLRIARLENEWYEDVTDPAAVVAALRARGSNRPDLFTFWQRMPDTEPLHALPLRWDSVAVLPIESYERWWRQQVKPSVRNHFRRSQRAGVSVRECAFDDTFVRGLVDIFNENPLRQNRPFWHYGKDFDTVKRQFARNLHRETLIGAFCGEEMIGFAMLADGGRYLQFTQIISKLAHRDKSPTNALIAKAVEICADRQLPYLIYGHWPNSTLADFKLHNGFRKVDLPRFYVPLTWKGRLALALGLEQGWRALLPEGLKRRGQGLRRAWHGFLLGRDRRA